MSKVLLGCIIFGLSTFFVSTVHAQQLTTSSTSGTVTPTLPVSTLKNDVMKSIKADYKEQRKTIQESMKLKKEEIRKTVADQKMTLKESLDGLSDQKKATVVERISDKLAKFNESHTDRWMSVLDTLQMRLDAIKEKSDAAKTVGKDMAATEANITAAQNAINAAQTAVTTQAGKTYPIQITTEARVHAVVQTVVTQFKTDMMLAQRLMVAAYESVTKASTSVALEMNGSAITPTQPTGMVTSTPSAIQE